MAAPAPKLEIAFGIAPTADPAPTDWVDVSAYLRSFNVETGRQRELDQVEAGVAIFTLDNRDRRFDPEYAAGAYYPNVKPLTHVRFSEGGSATAVYRGFSDRFKQTWVEKVNTDAVCVLECTDAFKVLANKILQVTDWEKEIRALAPTWWYRFSEKLGSSVIYDASDNAQTGVAYGVPTFEEPSLLDHDPDGAVSLTGFAVDATLDYQYFVVPRGIRSNPWSLVGAFNAGLLRSPALNMTLYSQYDPGGNFMRVNITTGGNLQVTWWPAGTSHIVTGTKYLYDGARHVFAIVVKSTSVSIYVDGVLDNSATFAADAATFPQTMLNRIGLNWPGVSDSSNANEWVGVLDEFALFDGTELTAAQVLTLGNAGLKPGGDSDTGTRAQYALTLLGWPAALADIDTGEVLVQPHAMADSALDYLTRLSQTEDGLLYVSPAGKITFKKRSYLVTPNLNASACTFGDGGGAEIPYVAVELDPGDEKILNEARVAREGGAELVIGDATSQGLYYTRTVEQTALLMRSDEEVRQRGNWLVHRFKNPHTAITSLTVLLADSRVTRSTVLGLLLGQVVTVKRRPPGGGTITKTARVEGFVHSGGGALGGNSWSVKLWLSGFDAAVDQPLIWDDATHGIWDTDVWG